MNMPGRFRRMLRRILGLDRNELAQLTRMCGGDQAAAARLIDGECSRTPGLSQAQACRRAIQRLQRDNR